jgi:UDPglucose 6-dehydrogenase
MKIAMIGAGYVGLVSGACFSEFGTDVWLVDTDASKVEALREGRIPIFEPGLDKLVADNAREGRLSFTTNLDEAVEGADAVFLAVGTPSRRGDGHADLTYVFAAAEQVAKAAKAPLVLVTKSTVPVGTGRKIKELVSRVRPDLEISVASNPEFLREGAAIGDFMRPDRVVIGLEDGAAGDRAGQVLRRLYRPLYLIETPIVATSIETAEITKYAANAFLAMKISFINEVADLCERAGANVQDVARGIGLDGRIGRKFLHAGPGYGGSCFPKDTLAFAKTGQDYGAPQTLVETTIRVNDDRKAAMAKRVIEACGGDVRGKVIAVLGLTFKPETDDMRDAPSLVILPRLVEAGATVRAFDPEGVSHARQMLPDGIHYAENALDAAKGADALVLLTEWNEFRNLSPKRLAAAMGGRVLLDLRNVYDPVAMREAGFDYHSVGRPDRDRGEGFTAAAKHGTPAEQDKIRVTAA